jgi:hypothetical protein
MYGVNAVSDPRAKLFRSGGNDVTLLTALRLVVPWHMNDECEGVGKEIVCLA